MNRVPTVVVGACLLLAGPIVVVGCGGGSTPAAATTTTSTRPISRLPANAVRIHWKKAALQPSPRAGHVCVTTYKTGHFCANYAAGEIPSVALKRQLRAKGWVVVESS